MSLSSGSDAATSRAGEATRASHLTFLAGGGEMGARMRALDWTATPLGAPENWPQSLKTIVRVMLDSRYAMWMLWGPELTFFCNDAYLPTVGIKGSWVLGAPAPYSPVHNDEVTPDASDAGHVPIRGSSAAIFLTVSTAIVPRVLAVVTMVIVIVVAIMGLRNHAGGRQRNQPHQYAGLENVH